MVQEGIVLGHSVSKRGIDVDRAKIDVIDNLAPLKSVKDIRSFLGHTSFYQRFIKDFSKIAKPLCKLLAKDAIFEFDDVCLNAFETLKRALVSVPILQPPNWEQPFEIICNASNFAVGTILGQRKEGKPYMIYYASKLLDKAQINYTTIEKELLAIVYAFDKFRLYLVGQKVIVYSDHTALKYFLSKKES